jgi:sec-independent protein translocase protein TatA
MFAWALGAQEILVLMILGVLLFGRRLPEVGQSLGRALRSFRDGLSGIEDSLTTPLSAAPAVPAVATPPQRVTPALPRFEGNDNGLPSA